MRVEVAGHRQGARARAPALLRVAGVPRLLRRMLGRHALRRGRHGQALALTRECDPVILAELGMFNATLDAFERQAAPETPDEVLACVQALAGTGQIASAAALARAASPGQRRAWCRRAASSLAGIDDQTALDLLDGDQHAGLRPALLDRIGQLRAAECAIERIGRDRLSADLDLLRANLALRQGDLTRHAALIDRALARHRLEPLERPDPISPVSVLNVAAAVAGTVEGPLVSVVMALRDVAAYVDAAIGSILGQTWRTLELIVVDDGSVDGTGAGVRAWADRDPRVRVLTRSTSGGAYAARNAGLALARGTFLTFHDGDDWSHPRRIERQVLPLLRNQRLLATAARWFRIEHNGRIAARRVWPLIRWHPASTLFRREPVTQQLGVFDPVPTGSDCEYWARLREVFGPARTLSLAAPLTLGAARADSLTTAPGTGYGPDGSAPARLAYWEAWHFWHARARRSGRPLRLLPGGPRPFELPPVVVPVLFAPIPSPRAQEQAFESSGCSGNASRGNQDGPGGAPSAGRGNHCDPGHLDRPASRDAGPDPRPVRHRN